MDLQEKEKEQETFHKTRLELKEQIKKLASRQKELKLTGNRSSLMSRRYEITALLNYYNEWRGKAYRHGSEEYISNGNYAYELHKLRSKYDPLIFWN